MAKQHDTKEVKKLFKRLEALGFVIVQRKGGGFKIYPPENVKGPAYFTHGTADSVKPIIRDFKRMYNVNVAA